VGVAHRLIWSLFANDPTTTRDFLWREEVSGASTKGGLFYLLSRREPNNVLGLFDIETKPFQPVLAVGDRLGFILRANPTAAVKSIAEPRARGKRLDVVMQALLNVPRGERADARTAAVQNAGSAWLKRQGVRAGFEVNDVAADSYAVRRMDRPDAKPIEFAVIDFQGHLTITNPSEFVAALAHGFGRAKSFGCGLMMIRRAPSANR
jgi:CRISPR system Cascade subunit CasE